MKTSHLIKQNDFCYVENDLFEKHLHIMKGDIVYVAGLFVVPESKEDPYTQRIKFQVHAMDDNKHVNTGRGLFVMDPRSLKKVEKRKQKKLYRILEKDFKERANNATSN